MVSRFIHRAHVRTYFCTACGRSRCIALFMCSFLNAPSTSLQRHTVFSLLVEKPDPKTDNWLGEPDVDEMSLGSSIRTVRIMSALVAVLSGINKSSQFVQTSWWTVRYLFNVAKSIHLDLNVKKIHTTANNY